MNWTKDAREFLEEVAREDELSSGELLLAVMVEISEKLDALSLQTSSSQPYLVSQP
jgi:hypothetical protein